MFVLALACIMLVPYLGVSSSHCFGLQRFLGCIDDSLVHLLKMRRVMIAMWHNRLNKLLFLLMSCLFFAAQVQAAKVGNLYTAKLLVAEQSVKADPALVGKALSQVLVKVSGRNEVVSNPQVKLALAEPDPYIQQFSYQATTIPLQTEDGREVLAQQLRIDFSPQLIDQLLSDGGIKPLGGTRPSLLLWIVEERGGNREYLGRDEDPVFATMLSRAEQRGLPIFRPLMDLEDEQALPVSDAWGFFADSIRKASARYQADAIMVGRIYRDHKGSWNSQWQLIWPQEVLGFEGQGESLEEQLASVIERSADRLFADFFKPSSGYDEGGIRVQITGVRGLDDYFQITNYLKELPAVSAVVLQSLAADQLIIRLMVDGSIKQIQNSIALNQRFRPEMVFTPESDGPLLRYHWQE